MKIKYSEHIVINSKKLVGGKWRNGLVNAGIQ